MGSILFPYMGYEEEHRRNEERGQEWPWSPPIRSKLGPIWSKIGPKKGLSWMRSFMKITQERPISDQKEHNVLGPKIFLAQLRLWWGDSQNISFMIWLLDLCIKVCETFFIVWIKNYICMIFIIVAYVSYKQDQKSNRYESI